MYENLRIKPSQVIGGGKGLYTWKKEIPHGRVISKFTGRKRTKAQIAKNMEMPLQNMLCVIQKAYV
jgi:hypothetical protein